jgi:hypothetical protein
LGTRKVGDKIPLFLGSMGLGFRAVDGTYRRHPALIRIS